MLFYLLLAISFLSSVNAFSLDLNFYKDTARIYGHEVTLNLSIMENSKWKQLHVIEQLNEAALVYAQCGIKLKVPPPKIIKNHNEIQFDLEGYDNPNDSRPSSSALNISKANSLKDAINIYFIQSFDPIYYSIKATSVPNIRIKQADQVPAKNSIWITRIVDYDRKFSPKEGGDPKGYSVLAHEMGHILLNSDHSEDLFHHNLMQKSSYSLNGRLTLKQCGKIKESPLVKRIPLNTTCPNIVSPLRSNIIFEGVEKDCISTKSLINKLEEAQDVLSDLNPAHGIDFYFTNSSNRIFYKDNNQFESALNLSYDYYGKLPLKPKQINALWVHELSHAIFNTQLSLDWNWYEKRMLLFNDWNQAIRENNNKKVISILDKIDSIPNNYEFEKFIAPYHELFADILTAIYFNDPNIISSALAPPNKTAAVLLSNEEKNYLVQRSFSNNLSVVDFSKMEVHSTFAPIRKNLWKMVQLKKSKGWSKKQIVRNIYKIFSKEIISLSKQKDINVFTAIDFNKRLLLKIQ